MLFCTLGGLHLQCQYLLLQVGPSVISVTIDFFKIVFSNWFYIDNVKKFYIINCYICVF